MKKIWKYLLPIVFVLLPFYAASQVNFEQAYITNSHQSLDFQEFFVTDLGNNNYKYVVYQYGFTNFSYLNLYNMDHTPYMLNIQIPLMSDSNSYYYRIGYVTTDLFDCDSTNIEFAMMLDRPVPNVSPNFAVYRTDGTMVFSKDTVGTIFCVGCGSGSWEMHPIVNTSAGAKLFLFNYVDSNGNYDPNGNQQTLVYSLCGSVPVGNSAVSHESNSFVKVFPNPFSKQVNFEITAPSHNEDYELTILNSAFQSIKTLPVKGTNYKMRLDGDMLSAGTYFYSLQSKSKIFQTGKFILAK